jgi:hypothetical protein
MALGGEALGIFVTIVFKIGARLRIEPKSQKKASLLRKLCIDTRRLRSNRRA